MKYNTFIGLRCVVSGTKRKILEIDEDLCNGCGQCVSGCAEGALEIVDGKARMVSDVYCDGLGACLGACPKGALRIVERESAAFSEKAVEEHLEGSRALHITGPNQLKTGLQAQWPVKLRLVSANASFFRERPLVVMADCAPFVLSSFSGHVAGKAVVIGCPKFDDVKEYAARLGEILKSNSLHEVAVVQMEVPCCNGLWWALSKALEASDVKTSVKRYVVSLSGRLMEADA